MRGVETGAPAIFCSAETQQDIFDFQYADAVMEKIKYETVADGEAVAINKERRFDFGGEIACRRGEFAAQDFRSQIADCIDIHSSSMDVFSLPLKFKMKGERAFEIQRGKGDGIAAETDASLRLAVISCDDSGRVFELKAPSRDIAFGVCAGDIAFPPCSFAAEIAVGNHIAVDVLR